MTTPEKKWAEIITIGDELISGKVVDTNSAYISRRLPAIGLEVRYHTSVGDNREDISRALRQALNRSQVAVICGGLGPTVDDITREVASEVFRQRLVKNEEVLDSIKDRFSRRGLEMTPNNERQAFFPLRAELIPNSQGTAWGFFLRERGSLLIFLPGVPRELEVMMEEKVIPLLSREIKRKVHIKSKVLNTFGLTESKLDELLKGTTGKWKNVSMGFLPKFPTNQIRIVARYSSEEKALRVLSQVEKELERRVGDYIYGRDEETMEEVVGRMLKENQATIAVAESCTGGLIGHRLTDVPGSSEYFIGGVICYSNQAKIDLLDVLPDTLREYGAVSRQAAVEMAVGVRRLHKTTVGLAVTGIAGPSGGSPEKPVGTVFIALADEERTKVDGYCFGGNREQVKALSSQIALDWVRMYLKKS
ncbi:MAG: competence/damage-inducible protein A [Deltaproteobacteria bacterium]|nr:MAG: competence/damage-inducible protein A [Deltaproteobacteria bacterium]